jgi:hypothetical protein
VVSFARVQHGRGEGRLVWGIRIVLGFQTEGGAEAVGLAGFEGIRAGHKITAVELNTGLVGVDRQRNSTAVAGDNRGRTLAGVPLRGSQFSRDQDKIMVVATAKFDL